MGGSALPPGVSTRFTVEIHYVGDTVIGQVRRAEADEPEPFTSWLDLLRLLEAPGHPSQQAP